MMEKRDLKGWLYLLPAMLFLGVFMVYPLVDVFIYSFEEEFNFASQSFKGYGLYNYSFVLRDPFFMQAVKKYVYPCNHHRAPFYRHCASDFIGP